MIRLGLPALAALAVAALSAALAPGRSADLIVVFTGEMKGYLSPCGCTKPMLGGIARRGAVIERLARNARPVLIENGDLTMAEGRQDELKAETIIDALGAMGYDAVGVGEKDLELGAEFLQALQARADARFLCANVADPEGRRPFARSVTLRRRVGRADRRVVVSAAMAGGFQPGAGFRRSDAVAALAPLARSGDIRILLFHGRRQDAGAIARALPGFSLIVYAHGPDTPATPVRIGTSTLVCSGTSGKYVGVAKLSASGAVRSVASIPLGESAGVSKRIEAIRSAYLSRVASENLLDMLPRSPLPAGESYAGSEACRGCHADAHQVWSASGHARAMRTLRKVGQDRDPECVPCHVVGAGHEGGYLDRKAPTLAHVGCENCHGPSARHVEDTAIRPSRGGQASCSPCHVPGHSPGFRYDRYWSKIRH